MYFSRWKIPTLCAALVALTLIPFGQVLDFKFVILDDGVYVYANPFIQQGLSADALKWAWTAGFFRKTLYIDYWQPVTIISRLIDFELFGAEPAGHHLVNLALHCANVALLFLLLLRLLKDPLPSAFTAAVFAVHPLQVESVAWVTERKDVLSTLFLLCTLHGYACWAANPSTRRYLAILALFAAGLMAKPLLLPLPLLLIAIDVFLLGRIDGRSNGRHVLAKIAVEKIPFFLLSIASVVITLVSQSPSLLGGAQANRLHNALVLYVIYLKKIFIPSSLVFRYSSLPVPLPARDVAFCVLLLALITWWALKCRSKCPAVPAGWLWFLIMLLPVISAADTATSDRFTYVPIIGIAMMIAWSATRLTASLCGGWRLTGWAIPSALALLVIAGMTWQSHSQAAAWHDSESLFKKAESDSRDVYPYNLYYAKYLARNNREIEALAILEAERDRHREDWRVYEALGVVMMQLERWDRAEEYLRMGMRIDPRVALFHSHLGAISLAKEDFDGAIKWHERALRIYPEFLDFHLHYAMALSAAGRDADALREFRSLLANAPNDPRANNGMGIALAKSGRPEEAISYFEKAVNFPETRIHAHLNLGWNYWLLDRYEKSEMHYRKAIEIDSSNVKAMTEIAPVLAKRKKPDEAIEFLRSAAVVDPNDKVTHLNLGILLRATGRLNEAKREFERSIELDPQFEPPRMELERLQDRPRSG